MDQKTLGERIRTRREELGLRPTDLANAVGVSVSAVLYWESGDTKNLKNDHLFALADKLEVNPRWLGIGQGPKRIVIKAMLLIGLLSPQITQQADNFLPTDRSVYYVNFRKWLISWIPGYADNPA